MISATASQGIARSSADLQTGRFLLNGCWPTGERAHSAFVRGWREVLNLVRRSLLKKKIKVNLKTANCVRQIGCFSNRYVFARVSVFLQFILAVFSSLTHYFLAESTWLQRNVRRVFVAAFWPEENKNQCECVNFEVSFHSSLLRFYWDNLAWVDVSSM